MTLRFARTQLTALAMAFLCFGAHVKSAIAYTSPDTLSSLVRNPGRIAGKLHSLNKNVMALGELERAKGTLPSVRNFSESVLHSHEIIDQKLRSVADHQGFSIVSLPVDNDDAATSIGSMKLWAGRTVDVTFVGAVIRDYERTLSELSFLQPELPASPLKQLVEEIIPVLRQHLRLALELEKTI